MNSFIKNIVIDKRKTIENRKKELEELEKDIELAKSFLSGGYAYCTDCDDFYLTKSFFVESETKEARICIYEDFINSGGNEYVDGYVDILYKVCPKGHKHEIDKKERRK